MPFTETFANKILKWMTANGSVTLYNAKVYIGLVQGYSEDSPDSITELPKANGYERVLVAENGKAFPALISDKDVSGRIATNGKQINWTKASPNGWPTANAFLLSSSDEVGEKDAIFFVGLLDQPMTCDAGAVALFDPGELKIQISNKDEKITD